MKSSVVKAGEKALDYAKNYSLKLIFTKLMYFISAVLVSRGCLLGSYYPFGLSFSASVGTKGFTPTLIGTFLGYLIPLRLGSSMRYISAIVSIGAVRWALNDLEKIKNHVLYTPAIVFASSFVTGFAVNCAQGFDTYNIMITILECFIAAAAGYFFDNSFKVLSNKKLYNLDIKEFSCIAISLSISLLSLSEISTHGVSLGRILGIVMILITSYSMGVIGGVLVGTVLGAILNLSSFELSYVSSAYGLSGMISGLFSSWGKAGTCISFLCSYFLLSMRLGDTFQIMAGIYEFLAAMIIFFLLPNSFFKNIKSSLPSFAFSRNLNFKETVVKKLKLISSFLSTIPECVDKTTADINALSFTSLEESCFDSIKSYCAGCSNCKFCWEENCKSTYNEVRMMIKNTFLNKPFEGNIVKTNILKCCKNTQEVLSRIYSIKQDFSTHKLLKAKTKEFKKVLEDHFDQMALLLEYCSYDFNDYSHLSEGVSNKLKLFLIKKGIKVESVRFKRDKEKRFFIDIETDISEKSKFNISIIKEISLIIGRNLDKPLVNSFSNSCFIQIFEKRNYKVNFSISQHAYNAGKFCGDNCRCFEDGSGRFNIVLSDGMGTGTSAALEATLVAELTKKLLKMDMSYELAIKFLNSILLLNNKEESIATLDVASIDLFSGKAKFIKAGSPATFLLREGEIKKISFSSLPVGILKEVSCSEESISLSSKDIVIMLSDGVTDIGEDWTLNLLTNIYNKPFSEISKIIVNEAVKARKNMRDDDITAIAFELEQLNI